MGRQKAGAGFAQLRTQHLLIHLAAPQIGWRVTRLVLNVAIKGLDPEKAGPKGLDSQKAGKLIDGIYVCI